MRSRLGDGCRTARLIVTNGAAGDANGGNEPFHRQHGSSSFVVGESRRVMRGRRGRLSTQECRAGVIKAKTYSF